MGDILMRTFRHVFIAVVAFTAAGTVRAQAPGLPDPTKPPAGLLATGLANAALPSSALQSIILSKGRKIAVINGQSVPLGGKYGDATLVAITASEVTLKSDKGMEVMKLYPDQGRTNAVPQSGRAPNRVDK
jgi:MSHA biogenesis protein MshK